MSHFHRKQKTIRGPKSAHVPVIILHPMTTCLFHDKDVSNTEKSDKVRDKDALRDRERSKQAAFFVSGSAFYTQESDFSNTPWSRTTKQLTPRHPLPTAEKLVGFFCFPIFLLCAKQEKLVVPCFSTLILGVDVEEDMSILPIFSFCLILKKRMNEW